MYGRFYSTVKREYYGQGRECFLATDHQRPLLIGCCEFVCCFNLYYIRGVSYSPYTMHTLTSRPEGKLCVRFVPHNQKVPFGNGCTPQCNGLQIVVCPFVLFLLTIVLPVLRFTDSDYLLDIFKLFLCPLEEKLCHISMPQVFFRRYKFMNSIRR